MIANLFEAFRRAMMANPASSRSDALDRFITEMRSDPEWLDVLAKDYFERQSNSWMPRLTKLGYVFGRSAKHVESIRRREVERAATVSRAVNIVDARYREITLLDMELPNGKALRFATGAECAKAGGFYAEIAKHIKPTQVVDKHLTEDDLKNVRARFFQSNTEAAA